MSNKCYQLSTLAGKDIENIWLYTYNTWSANQADYYYGQIIKTFEFITQSPNEGKEIDHIRKGYLRYPVEKHYIFYKKIPEGIKVIRILGQVMDTARHL